MKESAEVFSNVSFSQCDCQQTLPTVVVSAVAGEEEEKNHDEEEEEEVASPDDNHFGNLEHTSVDISYSEGSDNQ